MSESPEGSPSNRDITVPDEYPPRPSSMVRTEIHRLNSKLETLESYTTIVFSIIFFICGIGFGICAPLYPHQAKSRKIPIYTYGPVIGINFLTSILFFPVASRMVGSTTCKQSACTGIAMIGSCNILFGILALISTKLPFIILSYVIEIVGGTGFALVLASTFVAMCSQPTENTSKNMVKITVFFIIGLCSGPVIGEAISQVQGFSVPYYVVGIIAVLSLILPAIMLPEPDQKIRPSELSIVSWRKYSRLVIYCFLVFTAMNFAGYLSVVLEPYLRQFHLDKLFVGLLFSIPAFACGLSAFVWKWISKKGFNSVLLICFASACICGALLFLGPLSFVNLDANLATVSGLLVLSGVGFGGKLMCVYLSADRDIRSNRSTDAIAESLLIPTMFVFGSMLGYFTGSAVAGFAYIYLGLQTTAYVLFGLEATNVAVCVVFAFKRNYRNPKFPRNPEKQPILDA